jgi:hypothetical protein
MSKMVSGELVSNFCLKRHAERSRGISRMVAILIVATMRARCFAALCMTFYLHDVLTDAFLYRRRKLPAAVFVVFE